MNIGLIIVLCVLALICFILVIYLYCNRYENYNRDYNNKLFFDRISNQKKKSELVVAYCTEKLHWIDEVAPYFNKVTVYTKCSERPQYSANNVSLIVLDNIGSCDHAYLTYIITNYDKLPHFIQFAKGSFKATHRQSHECRLCTSKTPMFYHHYKKFSLSNWIFTNNPNMRKKFKFLKSPHKNLKDWVDKDKYLTWDIFEKAYCNTKWGGNFCTTKKQILHVPKKVWENLRSQQTAPSEEIDHYIERTWKPLLCQYELSSK